MRRSLGRIAGAFVPCGLPAVSRVCREDRRGIVSQRRSDHRARRRCRAGGLALAWRKGPMPPEGDQDELGAVPGGETGGGRARREMAFEEVRVRVRCAREQHARRPLDGQTRPQVVGDGHRRGRRRATTDDESSSRHTLRAGASLCVSELSGNQLYVARVGREFAVFANHRRGGPASGRLAQVAKPESPVDIWQRGLDAASPRRRLL